MDKEKFLITVIDFIERGILPKVKSDVLRWAGGGLLPMLLVVMGQKMDELSGATAILGITDLNGNVDVQQLKKFFDGAFRLQPELRIEAQGLLPKNSPEILKDLLDGVAIRLSAQDANDLIAMLDERR